MKLFVMRHAQASFNALSDRERPITETGISHTQDLLEKHVDSFAQVNCIWSSDLLRAKQTAEYVSKQLNIPSNEQNFLSPDGDINAVLNECQKLPKETCLFIVSHQPLVGELVSHLVHGNIQQAHPYSTSEVLELDLDMFEPGMAKLTKQYLPL